jgi:uncharacterized membrane protein YhiD involved in acid resistance
MGNITFKDIIKQGFWENFSLAASDLTLGRIIFTLLITLLIGLYIFYIYKKTFKGVMYNKSFNISLVIISLVSSLIIMTISSDLALSLGMVGALSIVRFRTAIKNPMDIVYMFWAIAVGITAGANFYITAVAGSLFIGIVLLLLSNSRRGFNAPYLLIIHFNPSSSEQIDELIKKYLPKYNLKSKIVSKAGIELTLEIKLKDNNTDFVNEFLNIKGVKNASLVSYQGDLL